MRKILMIALMIFVSTGQVFADQSGHDFSIVEYFASNALIAQNLDTDIPALRSVAVLELEGIGIDQTLTGTLTDRLRTELYETGKYKVMAPQMMNDIFTEQGFQPADSISDEYMVEAGKILDVKQIIGGSISLVDSIYTAFSKIVDTETGEIIKTATYDTQEGLDNLLNVGMQDIAHKLASDDEIPEAPQQAEAKIPVKKPEEPVFVKEDLFATPLTGDIYEFDAKSTKRAFFYSLLVPGAGEYYSGSKIKPIVFFGIEALLWTSYFIYDGKGDGKKDDYREYADEHYYWWDFMQWWNTLDSAAQDTFSHRMPWDYENNCAILDHEYYEDIGKYDQFQIGWDDIGQYQYPPGVQDGETVLSPHREFYLDLRKQANDFYQTANTMIMLSLGNRIISAFDAALTAKKYNKGQKRYSFKLKTKDFGSGNVPILTCTYRF